MKLGIILISDGVDRVCRNVAAGCLILMVAIVLLQVGMRYGAGNPPDWTDELARFAMIWGGLLGASVAFKAGFDPVLFGPAEGISNPARFLAGFFRGGAVVVFLVPVLYFCLVGLDGRFETGFLGRSVIQTVDSLGFQAVYMAAAVPVSVTSILIHLVARLAGDRAEKGSL